jgi:predicted methyltransferase
MNRIVFALAAAGSLLALAGPTRAQIPDYVANAVADPARAADRAIDERRKVAEVVTFSEAKPGDKVLELIPGSGYFTRVFSKVVGPQGRVYAV